MKGTGAQAIFYSVLLVRDKGANRRTLIGQVNKWLQNWCCWQGSGFCDHRNLLADQLLLGRDGIHVTKWGKAVFHTRMDDLIRSPLN